MGSNAYECQDCGLTRWITSSGARTPYRCPECEAVTCFERRDDLGKLDVDVKGPRDAARYKRG